MDNTQQQSIIGTLLVIIRNREKIIIQRNAKSVTSYSDKGAFDILPQHANFITLIKKSITIVYSDGKKEVFPIENGVMKVASNEVYIYVGI